MDFADELQSRINSMVPEFRGWYQGFSDAGFWIHGHYDITAQLPAPDHIYIQTTTGTIEQPFDPGQLWDLIIWGDDGHISLFRIRPDDGNLKNVIIQFSTTESPDAVPDWSTPEREDFIQEYNDQMAKLGLRYSYIPGSGE